MSRPSTSIPPPVSWAALVVILIGTFVTTLDFFIVNVAIPSLATDLHATPASIEWVIAGYAIAIAGGLIVGARLGDLFGHRRLFMVGLVVFTLASAACGAAATSGDLIAARIVQGAGAALMTPQVLSMIGHLYAGERRQRAFMLYGLTLGLAAVLGQLIGGLLIEADLFGLGWRLCFLVNLPIGIGTLALVPILIPTYRTGATGGLDLPGALLGTAAISAIVLALIQGRQLGWPLWISGCLAGGLIAAAIFVWHQRRRGLAGRAPLMDLTIFDNRRFAVSTLTMFAFFITNASFYFTLSQYLQGALGLSPLGAGALFGLMGVGYFATVLRPPFLVARLGRHWILAGVVVMALGLALLLLATLIGGVDTSIPMVVPGMVIAGMGVGMILAPLSGLVMSTVEPPRLGSASGILGTVQQVGNSLGIALVGLVFFDLLGDAPNRTEYGDAFAGGLVVQLAVLGVVLLFTRWLGRLMASSEGVGWTTTTRATAPSPTGPESGGAVERGLTGT
jgi:EmrB/QacA subfamily drug resistance transporter